MEALENSDARAGDELSLLWFRLLAVIPALAVFVLGLISSVLLARQYEQHVTRVLESRAEVFTNSLEALARDRFDALSQMAARMAQSSAQSLSAWMLDAEGFVENFEGLHAIGLWSGGEVVPEVVIEQGIPRAAAEQLIQSVGELSPPVDQMAVTGPFRANNTQWLGLVSPTTLPGSNEAALLVGVLEPAALAALMVDGVQPGFRMTILESPRLARDNKDGVVYREFLVGGRRLGLSLHAPPGLAATLEQSLPELVFAASSFAAALLLVIGLLGGRVLAAGRELRKEQREHSHMVQHLPSLVLRCDLELRCRSANPAFCHFFGVSAENIAGRPIATFLPTGMTEKIGACLRREESATEETFEVLVDGDVTGERWLASRAVLSMDAEGQPDGAYLFSVDISSRTQAEEAKGVSIRKLRHILETYQVGVWGWDLARGTLEWDTTIRSLYQYHDTTRPPTYEDFERRLHPEDRERVKREIDRSIATGEPLNTRYRLLQTDGRILHIRALGNVYRDGDGNVVSIFGLNADATDELEVQERLKQLNKELRESEERFRSAMQYSGIGMALVAPDGSWLDVNHAICDIVGYTREELLATTFQAITHPDDLEADLKLVGDLLAGRINTYSLEKRYFHKAGNIVWILLTVSLVRDAEGGPVHFISQIQDISKRKEAEAEVKALATELEQRVEARTQDLKEITDELESFSYSVSHDLRAPLRHMSGYVRLLQRRIGDKLDEKSQRYLDTISGSAEHLSRLIDELLALSRTGRQDLVREWINLDQIVHEVREVLQSGLDDRIIRWEIGELPEVLADRKLLRLVIQNLLENAIKFTRVRKEAVIGINCSVEANGTRRICIQDNGAGFDMAYADKLFGAFQRLHRDEEFEGTGVGLASVRRIVTRHGGEITAWGAIDEGARFCFSIPTTSDNGRSLHAQTHPAGRR